MLCAVYAVYTTQRERPELRGAKLDNAVLEAYHAASATLWRNHDKARAEVSPAKAWATEWPLPPKMTVGTVQKVRGAECLGCLLL